MDFVSIVLFLVIYYLRPQEWSEVLAGFRPVTFIMLFALVAMVHRDHKFSIRDLLRTPHDWMMLALFAWIIGTSPTSWETFGAVRSLLIFYVVIVQALSSTARIQRFLNWWAVMILIVVLLALAGEYGFDPFGSHDLTHGIMQGRLVLNLSLYENPNALGHAVAPVLVMLYFICVWNRPIFMKQATLVVMLLPGWCVFLTQSKGAFLSSFVTSVLSMAFGRPKVVQIFIVWFAVTMGWASLYALPRMQELNRTQTNKAIMGRVIAFQHGLKVIKSETTGVGYGNWNRSFYTAHGWNKAPHSGFVGVGAEQGFFGFCLYLGVIYCSLRVLITCKTTNTEEERIRRLLFCLVIAYTVSAWMIDLGYWPTFFIMAACVAAFHRQLLLKNKEPAVPEHEPEMAPQEIPAPVGGLLPALAPMPMMISEVSGQAIRLNESAGSSASIPVEQEQAVEPAIRWSRIGIIDVALIWVMGELFLWYWEYVCKNF